MGYLLRVVIAAELVVSLVPQTPIQSLPREATESANAVSKLRDEPTYIVPTDLAELVGTAEAAVIGRVVALGDVRLVPDLHKQQITKVELVDGFTAYRVSIVDVLYNRLKTGAPPLRSGVDVELTKKVGRQEAEAFLAMQTPVKPGDECLLFLWHRPGAAEWSVLQWPLQFRKSIPIPDGVESIAALPSGRKLLSTEWLGPSVPLVVSGKAHSWSALVDRVRRVGSTLK
jgi:hypothetical protein